MTVDDDGVTPPSAVEGQLTAWVGEQLSAMRAELDTKVSNDRADLECMRVHAKLDGLEANIGRLTEQLAALVAQVRL